MVDDVKLLQNDDLFPLSLNSFIKVRDLRFLSEYTSLQSLVLDHNQLTPHLKMPEMPLLHTFWVNHNNIENLAAPSYFNDGTYEQYTDYRFPERSGKQNHRHHRNMFL
ncbi:hypothetical protein MAR_003020 [Mya arenaria]|uniref:Uncharacterized protein n=1 Tax=Mya arenaria TaxID=6604 RepID=A0ABY7G4U6_MYAAR|nr:hypothetical protein MAR_003020 [Mya arenaria]